MRLIVWGVVFGLSEAYKAGQAEVMGPSDSFIDLGIMSTAKKLRAGVEKTFDTVKCSASSDPRCKPKSKYREDVLRLMRQGDDAALRNLAQIRTNYKNYGVTAAEAQDIWNQAVKSASFDVASFETTYGSKAPSAASSSVAAATPLAAVPTTTVTGASPLTAGAVGTTGTTVAAPLSGLSGAVVAPASTAVAPALGKTASLTPIAQTVTTTVQPLSGLAAGLVSTTPHP